MLPVTELDCGFLITSAVIKDNGSYYICVQANDQTLNQIWNIWNGGAPPDIASGTLPTMCFDLASSYGPSFTIFHTVSDQTGKKTCPIYILIEDDTLCQEGIVTANVENCNLETTINIDITNIGTPYAITFGDGSPAEQSSANQVTHTYGQPGTYFVCLSYYVPATEGHFVTCCYPIEVAACICPENVVSVVSVEPCTWVAEMNFALNIENFPITVDYGDGTSPEVVTGPSATHDFPDNGVYNVCYTYEVFPGDTLQCCEWVYIPGCCLNPYFELNAIVPSPSCLNPLYRVSHGACQGGIVEATHIWVFSDGKIEYGPNPDDHLFTNFVNDTGWVWVIHTITCCEESASDTVWVQHPQGAYLGTPGQELFITQLLPPGYTQNVEQFIHQNANGPLPLTIDGTLVINVDASFGFGTWNMGKDAEILVSPHLFNPDDYKKFRLDSTIIRSAVRLPGRDGCCRWEGIHSEGLTYISLVRAWIMDANYAIHYHASEDWDLAGAPYPVIYSIGTQYVNNYYAVKSEGQYVGFSKFLGNSMNGAPHPQVCDCNAVNAFDFRDVSAPLTVQIDPHPLTYNAIFNYEQAFHFENSNLYVRGFNIDSLRNYEWIDLLPDAHNNPDGDGAIGIDYQWGNGGNSSLNMDKITFSDFVELSAKSVAVRDSITAGKHTLTAIANQPLSSITTSNIAGGYDLSVGNFARLAGTIKGNDISTNGGSQYGFGITGSMQSSNNTLKVLSNRFNINSGSPNQMNGGIFLHSDNVIPQNYRILDDTINVYLTQGAGIGITNARNFSVRRNILTNWVNIPGIRLSDGGNGLVDCNNIQGKTNGITVLASKSNQYGANYFDITKHDMEFTGVAMGSTPSSIWWNRFNFSSDSSIYFNNGSFCGTQNHTKYNAWTPQYQNGKEVHHENSSGPPFTNSRFKYPSGYAPGTVYHPDSHPPGLFFSVSSTITPLDTAFCSAANDNPPVIIVCCDSLQSPNDEWESIVQDTALWNGLTAAEQTFMRQEIYGLLLENPDWADSSATLSGFMSSHDAGFVGRSETLKHDWQALLLDISGHQESLEPTRAAVDSLSGLAQEWLEAMQEDTTLQDSLLLLLNPVLAEGDSLIKLLEQADSLFFLTVQDSVSSLLSQNALLEDSTWHFWCEKRYNEIALRWLAGSEPDSAATADLRIIAQTCLSDGGRAVLGARGLCEVWLKEHYGEDSCQGVPQGRSAEGAAPAKAEAGPGLRIVPNPADDAVRIFLEVPEGERPLRLQVLTLNGQQVYAGLFPSNGELVVPVAGWQNGLYIARVTGGILPYSRSFVVQHR